MRNKRGREDGKCSWYNYISFSAHSSWLNRQRLTEKAWCVCQQFDSLCTSPIYWCCWPVSTNILVLLIFKKSAKFCNFVNVSVSLRIGAAGTVPPFAFVQSYGKNWHNCLHFEYNGAAVLAAPIIAYTDMFTMCDVYSVHWVWKIY